MPSQTDVADIVAYVTRDRDSNDAVARDHYFVAAVECDDYAVAAVARDFYPVAVVAHVIAAVIVVRAAASDVLVSYYELNHNFAAQSREVSTTPDPQNNSSCPQGQY